jgi:hypothetical protein
MGKTGYFARQGSIDERFDSTMYAIALLCGAVRGRYYSTCTFVPFISAEKSLKSTSLRITFVPCNFRIGT